jgi:hypothetical protein
LEIYTGCITEQRISRVLSSGPGTQDPKTIDMAPKETPEEAQSGRWLKDAPEDPNKPAPPEFKIPDGFRDMGVGTFMIVLAAVTSRVSQLSLAPVYGSIPSSVNHQAAIAATALIGWTTQWYWRPHGTAYSQYLPLWAICAPVLTCVSFQFSDSLGLIWGPIIGGLLNCHSIIFPMMYAAAAAYDGTNPAEQATSAWSHLFGGIPSLGMFMAIDWFIPDTVSKFIATWSFLNPFNAQLIIGLYLLFALTDRRAIVAATVSIATVLAIVSPYGSGPFSTITLDASLNSQNWTLLDRQWSNTGYISVLENTQANYRVMRCDHSLLGGEWQLTDERRAQGWKKSESIYAVFHMLEAVRLIKTEPQIIDAEAQALIIGLGIGTAPSAFIGHGINTTIVELDPVVHAMAIKHFALPKAHTAILSDAIAWVDTQAHPTAPIEENQNPSDPSSKAIAEIPSINQYDYILHDVFTGGAEPLPLFTTDFLSNLRSLLKPNGVAALNYAGDLDLPLTAKVLNTIDLAFDRQCALYRDSAPPPKPSPKTAHEQEAESEKGANFANYIVFCRNAPGPVAFRQPTPADFLGSISRKQHLYPRAEFAVDFPLRGTEKADEEVLVEEDVDGWKREQEESASRHWGIMRVVLPGRIWSLY